MCVARGGHGSPTLDDRQQVCLKLIFFAVGLAWITLTLVCRRVIQLGTSVLRG